MPYCFTVSSQGYLSVWDVVYDEVVAVGNEEEEEEEEDDDDDDEDSSQIHSKMAEEESMEGQHQHKNQQQQIEDFVSRKHLHDHTKISRLQLGAFANLLQNDPKYGSRSATASVHADSKDIVRCAVIVGKTKLLESRDGREGEDAVNRIALDTPFLLFLGLEDGRGIVLELNLSFSESVGILCSLQFTLRLFLQCSCCVNLISCLPQVRLSTVRAARALRFRSSRSEDSSGQGQGEDAGLRPVVRAPIPATPELFIGYRKVFERRLTTSTGPSGITECIIAWLNLGKVNGDRRSELAPSIPVIIVTAGSVVIGLDLELRPVFEVDMSQDLHFDLRMASSFRKSSGKSMMRRKSSKSLIGKPKVCACVLFLELAYFTPSPTFARHLLTATR